MTYHSKAEEILMTYLKSKKVKLGVIAKLYGYKQTRYLRVGRVWRSGERPQAIINFLKAAGHDIK